ncbi:MAG: hypothetical protein R3E90_00280 [Marinicella sp.]
MEAKTKNRLTIVITILLFMGPVVAAYLLSSGLIDYKPENTKNKGHFVSPIVKIEDLTKASWVKDLIGTWTLIRVVPETCVNQCQAFEDELSRYQKSLAHRADKMQLMLIADDFLSEMTDKYPHVKKVSMVNELALQQEFARLSSVSLGKGHGLYVVAPEGYLMMAFSAENTSSEIIKDLSLLVKRKGD